MKSKSTLKIHGRDVNHKNCPIVEASKIVGDFWNLWIIRSLQEKPLHFSQLLEQMPTINKVTLNTKLKLLIDTKIITKCLDDNLRPHYKLAKKGLNLKPVLDELEKFGNANFS